MSSLDHDDAYRRIASNPNFQALVHRRGRFALTLTAIMMGLYFAFILLIAFAPQVLGIPVADGAMTTWGIVIGIGLILAAIILTGIYVRRANGEFDRLVHQILEEDRQ
ncbi:uncharacterized membrane protein (DUF485 family) [Kushneria sinocarnis]|uniref:Uncharacterized membrane protein (DUF485 family) n=1 Tax=Kushneria sinocarnis TaxID=595502 RepID=A0A420X1C5_9GAMM|nr:DUF485 domain-containing protein [Kushneria sinocarnis]RKR07550.1 uncharacterized membrane protein (DUF485 family) [Kushneria sinocarnis]